MELVLAMRSGLQPTPMQLFNLLVEAGDSPDEAGDVAWKYSEAVGREKPQRVEHPADAVDVLRAFTLA